VTVIVAATVPGMVAGVMFSQTFLFAIPSRVWPCENAALQDIVLQDFR